MNFGTLQQGRGLCPYLGHSIVLPEVSVWGTPRACTAISHTQLSALPAPGPPKCPQVLGTSLPLGEWFPWNPSSTWGSEICGAAACLDHGPLGPGAEAWSVWVLCPSPYLHGALTPRPWRSGWFVISLHRERVQTPHQTSSCFMAAGLRRPWPCCLLLPGVHSNSLLLVILWTSGIFVC